MQLSTIIKNKKNTVGAIAAGLIILGLSLQLWNGFNDSLTADESPHIAASYSYVHFADNRLNPEHPPLVKILAGIPMQFVHVDFPTRELPWFGVNKQWEIGWHLLYHNSNYQSIIYAGRLGAIFLTTVFAILFFWISRKFYGDRTALIALFLFTFSPTILAHGHLITTDVAAAFGLFIGFWGFAAFLQKQTLLRFLWGSVAIAIALAAKFSTVVLLPYLLVMLIAYLLIFWPKQAVKKIAYSGSMVLCALLLLTVTYNAISFKYPVTKRVQDAQFLLQEFGVAPKTSNVIEHLVQTPLIWGAGEYGLGLAMTVNRAMAGSSYFFGQYYNGGSPWYFPFAYAVKEPLALHVLSILLICLALLWLRSKKNLRLVATRTFLQKHFFTIAMAGLLALFWALAIHQTINLGVRHILPVLPLTYLLIAIGITQLRHHVHLRELVLVLLFAFAASSLYQYPHELAYGSELIGGPENLHYYLSDSNVDWGQDLLRLESFALDHNITQLHLLYFGQQPLVFDPRIQILPWPDPFDPNTASGFYAISETYLRTECLGRLVLPCPVNTELFKAKPIRVIGNSIDLYQF